MNHILKIFLGLLVFSIIFGVAWACHYFLGHAAVLVPLVLVFVFALWLVGSVVMEDL